MTMSTEKDEWGNEFAHVVNGVKIFAMGADYIPEDHLLGRVTPEVTRKLLNKAKFANFNAIRVWGGGYYPDDWFFDICDELGLVVWQDFMFACAVYDLTPEFEANIKQEFIENIKRIRHHACLGLWCGNNEMEMFVEQRNQWVTKPSHVRDYFLMYERIIPEIVKEYDPQTFYWPASPSSGGSMDFPNDPDRGDVHNWEVWHGNKPFSEYRKYYFRYLSEFGFQAFPSEKTIETFTDDPKDKKYFLLCNGKTSAQLWGKWQDYELSVPDLPLSRQLQPGNLCFPASAGRCNTLWCGALPSQQGALHGGSLLAAQ